MFRNRIQSLIASPKFLQQPSQPVPPLLHFRVPRAARAMSRKRRAQDKLANVANLTEASGPVTVVRSTHGRAVMRISFIEFFERGRSGSLGSCI